MRKFQTSLRTNLVKKLQGASKQPTVAAGEMQAVDEGEEDAYWEQNMHKYNQTPTAALLWG